MGLAQSRTTSGVKRVSSQRKADIVARLIATRFPDLESGSKVRPPAAKAGPSSPSAKHTAPAEIEAYRVELQKLTLKELQLLAQEQGLADKAPLPGPQDAGRSWFSDEPTAADFNYWGQMAYWTPDEAVALALGKCPDTLNWDKVEAFVLTEPLARQYAHTRRLVLRATEMKQLAVPATPMDFVAWAARIELHIPEELVTAVKGLDSLPDWKAAYLELKSRFESLEGGRARDSLHLTKVIEQRDRLREELEGLRERQQTWEFDPAGETYPYELDIAMQTWAEVSRRHDPSSAPRPQIEMHLMKHHARLTETARERIATVCNWNKMGRKPPHQGEK